MGGRGERRKQKRLQGELTSLSRKQEKKEKGCGNVYDERGAKGGPQVHWSNPGSTWNSLKGLSYLAQQQLGVK